MRTLLIDNYDSFTFNLFQALAELDGDEPIVVRNDELTWEDLSEGKFEAIVISPGPGRPDNPRDFGMCERIIRDLPVPLLGVCLGHQGIGQAFGGSVVHAPEPMHGRVSRVHHHGADLFAGIASPFDVVRYHSLIVEQPLSPCLEPIAWTDDGLVMGLRHRTRPIWGVQFHPESICTLVGMQLLKNFYALAAAHATPTRSRRDRAAEVKPRARPGGRRSHEVFVKQLRGGCDLQTMFRAMLGSADSAFWLDRSLVNAGRRFSAVGGADHGEIVRYTAGTGRVVVGNDSTSEGVGATLFEYLNDSLSRRAVSSPRLPFDFNCGYVGYFGYEMKVDCGGRRAHFAPTPDAMLLFADRVIVVDHERDETYLLWYGASSAERDAERWFAEMIAHLRSIAPLHLAWAGPCEPPQLVPDQSRERYCQSIHRCLEYIRNGESYEICLTNTFRAKASVAPLAYYETLRTINPAPHAAYLQFGKLAVVCSSPESFLKIGRDRSVETKPIKGTARRGITPAEDAYLRDQLSRDPKTRSENLMIVDLLRNDLGRVCEIGSVSVPNLMYVETYATVHQLVSTIVGRLRSHLTAVDCLRAAFPGGSMTGAPKLRTLDIIDELEPAARGVYAGSIGFLALNGSADLNIVIRTAVFEGDDVSIGTGGAIVALSDAESEWNELLLKTRALESAFEAMANRTSNEPRVASL